MAWPKVVMVEIEKTGEGLFGEVESAGLAERMEGVESKERKGSKKTFMFLAKRSELHSEKGSIRSWLIRVPSGPC